MALEVLALPETAARGIADPALDPILAVSFAVHANVVNWDGTDAFSHAASIVVSDDAGLASASVTVVSSELELLDALGALVNRWNPELLVGYDFLRGSWHYVCERANLLRHNFVQMANRVKGALNE